MNVRSRSDAAPSLATIQLLFIRLLAIIGMVIGVIGVVPVVLVSLQQGRSLAVALYPLVVAIASGISLYLSQRGNQRAAAGILIVTITLSTIAPPPALYVTAVVACLAGAVLGNRSMFLAVVLFVLGRFAFAAVITAQTYADDFLRLGTDIMAPLVVLAIVTLTVRLFVNVSTRSSEQFIRGAQMLQSTAAVTQVTSQILDLRTLLNEATRQISERFGFYHVQVFLLDNSGDYAELVASTGEIGQKLLERKHRLAVGSRSVIGQTTSQGSPVIARDDDPQNVRFRNELLPATRAELALPIRDGDRIIGALDVQSTEVDSFDDAVVQALQVLANLLATAIRNARLFEQQATTVHENQRLYRQTQANLEEIQRLNRELTGQVWRDFLREGPMKRGVTLTREALQPDDTWSETLVQAAKGETVYAENGAHHTVALPLMLRGELIGAVELELARPLDDDELLMLRAVIDRLTISLENARLYEATQAATAQEARLNQIAARYERVSSVDELLRITLRELGDTLGAQRGAIRLGALSETNGNGGGA